MGFRDYFKRLLGEEYEKFRGRLLKPLRPAIRITRKAPENILERLERKGFSFRQIPRYPKGFRVEGDVDKLGNMLEYALGYFYFQEAASMIPPVALAPERGDRILDLCAAPGSKTTQIADMIENEGIIVANDINKTRLRMLGSNVQRTSSYSVIVTSFDGRRLPRRLRGKFDKVLVDAPCSALGTSRRYPENLEKRNLEFTLRVSRLQYELLKSGILAAKKGGIIVYSTCTLTVEENEAVVDRILKEFEGEVEIERLEVPGLKYSKGLTSRGEVEFDKELSKTARIYPRENDTEGFYIAVLRRVRKKTNFQKIDFPKTNFPKMDFLDREDELRLLRSFKGFALIYGRRRIGKTALAKKALPNALYINGFEDTLESIAEKLSVEPSRTSIILKAKEVIIDEFQNFEDIAKKLAYAYELAKDARVVLVTSILSMARMLISEGSPLFGRIGVRILLKQLPRKEIVKKYGLETYLLFGGTPQYLERGLEYGKEGFITPGTPLYNEAEFLFSYEFKSPRYRELLKKTLKPRPIKNKALEYYAKKLEEADIIRSVTRTPRLWELCDNYIRTRLFTARARKLLGEARKKEFYKILPGILDANFESLFRDKRTWEKFGVEEVYYPYGIEEEFDAIVKTEDRFLIVEVKRRKIKEEDCRGLIKKLIVLGRFRFIKNPEPVLVGLEGKTSSCESYTVDDFLRLPILSLTPI